MMENFYFNKTGVIENLERLFLVVTNQCNAHCHLCAYWKALPPVFLSLPALREKVIPLVSHYRIEMTLITGGEPTLHPHLPEILTELSAVGTRCSLITNGTCLEHLFKDICDHVDSYMFSLDAPDEKLYREIRGLDNFSQLLQWPEKIVAHHYYTPVAYNCLLQKKNVGHLIELYRLVAELPINGIFFNVPEIKTCCFGLSDPPGNELPAIVPENALLTDEEIMVLGDQFKTIRYLDASRGKLFQGESFFENCLRYFRGLQQRNHQPINPEAHFCPVPFTSSVIDERLQLRPCFYLPFSHPFDPGNSVLDPLNHQYLKNLRREFFSNPGFRYRYCSNCLQFQV